MPAIAWDASLESGITEFDDHHRYLIDLLNTLYDDFTAGAPDEHLGSILHELAEYASYHFSAEESWMRNQYYPELNRHREEHDRFSRQISEMLQDYRGGRLNLSTEILAFLNNWLTDHILTSDGEYVRFYAALQAEEAKGGRLRFMPPFLKKITRRNFPLHLHISTLLLVLLLLVSGLIGGFGYKLSRDMLEVVATDLTGRISREVSGELRSAMAPAEMAVNLLSHSTLTKSNTRQERLQRLGLMREVLENSAHLSSIYFGYVSGDFFFVRRVTNDADRMLFNAPPGTRYIVQSVERTGAAAPRGSYLYLDESLGTLREDDRPDYAADYDPRGRDWYREAMAAPAQVKTPPYLFFSNRKVGTTLARKDGSGESVAAADILLETLSTGFAGQKVTPGTQIALVDAKGFVIAHEDVQRLVELPEGKDAKPRLKQLTDFGIPVLARVADALGTVAGESVIRHIRVDEEDWRVSISPVLFEGAHPLYLLIAIPDRELLAAAIKLRSLAVAITALIILLAIPLTWFLARSISKPLRKLAAEGEAIRTFDFSEKVRVRSVIKEVHELGVTMEDMKRTIRRFLTISEAVATEEDFERLLPMLLAETLAAADADAAVLYLADNGMLVPVSLRRRDGLRLTVSLPPVVLDAAGPLLESAISGGGPQCGRFDAADGEATGLSGIMAMLDVRHAMAVPLLNRQRQLVGALLLLRKTAIEEAHASFVTALSSSAASSLEMRELIKSQKELFEAFIQLIAGAIDAKSPYTGGHCARVPELTEMLARAACAETSGPYRDFDLDAQDWEAVHVASWLHDCGKVTTPEYVVDKATKLETICDRIHEVRTRFEVLKRDAEIACLKAIAGGADEAAAREHLAAELAQLDDDFSFIATCNEGGEFMVPDKLERLKAIASRSWLRTLDDRIGISHEEKERKAHTPATAVPVREPLLADKPEHLIPRRAQDRLTDDNRWGFRMPQPELLYNRGEIYNLSVGRGTLSEEERYKINEHIVQSLIMLSQLPFPKHLRQVPEIAGGHHEKMDGTGYPKRLTRDEMSPVARMMAIADIFEALTAVDRPYKKGKTLSESIRIMSFMKKDQHIDPDLFDLFLRSGVYREYAVKFMKPEQIDEVPVEEYLQR